MRNLTTTMVEFFIVVTLAIGIVICIAIPTLIGSIQRNCENMTAGNAAFVALALSNYKTDHGSYPSGKSSTEAFKQLFPTYLQDPAYLFLSRQGGHKAFDGTSTADLTKTNVCWAITMNNNSGLTGKEPGELPILIDDIGSDYPTFSGGETRVTLTDNNMWGIDGVTIARLDQSTAFLRPKSGVVTLTGPKFQPAAGANYQAVAP